MKWMRGHGQRSRPLNLCIKLSGVFPHAPGDGDRDFMYGDIVAGSSICRSAIKNDSGVIL